MEQYGIKKESSPSSDEEGNESQQYCQEKGEPARPVRAGLKARALGLCPELQLPQQDLRFQTHRPD